jgi:Zn-dependent peptidase ImmA (M78 family)/DNA-binding XRE family transcriptional regulator
MNNFSSRLKTARQRKGWSMQELADALKLSKQSISKYELEQSVPDIQRLLQLCEVLGVRPDYFTRPNDIAFGNISFRKLVKFPEREKQRVIEATRDELERYLELESILGLEVPFENPLKEISVTCFENAEYVAAKLREMWGLGTGPLSNVIELLEDHNIKVIETGAMDSFSGFSSYVGSIPVIVLNNFNDVPLDRKRFTALHELGHLLLSIDTEDSKLEERICDRFAAAMLFPAEAVEASLGKKRSKLIFPEIGALKLQWGISMSAIVMRANHLGIISDSYYKNYMFLLSKWGYKKREPEKYDYKGSEKSNRFEQLLFKALAEEFISQGKAAALLNLKLAEFRDRYDHI